MNQLSDKVIFITGDASGIGKACVDSYVREGPWVFIIDKDEPALQTLLNQIKPPHQGFAGDVSKQADVETALNKAIEVFGRIDAIHNNAGVVNRSATIEDTTEDEWDALMSIKLKSLFRTIISGLVSQKASKECILNTSSLTAEIRQNLHAAYMAAKGVVNTLTKSMVLDFIVEYLDHIHALGYCPNADVGADAAVFLLCDSASFVTGCIMPVSGGAELGCKR